MNMDTDLAWAAGIIDGEACITIHRYHNKSGGQRSRDYYQALLVVTNTDPRIPMKLKAMFGGVVRCKIWSRKRFPNAKPVYDWRRISSKAARIVEQVRPYLVSKADQADVMLAFQKLIRPYGNGKGGWSKALSDSDWEQRRSLFDSIKQLKTPAPLEAYQN